ncbi:rod shape-determining protein MreC [Patulibacter sp. NPDC049589]|uniref:rod shape-determining protein MreC n=1 Tax=Patulibacter sp. NPDC049589 TaxID=3154731 RepID=UPI00342F25AD
MIDPAARRRRIILAALVAVCLVLITAGFGASSGATGGPLGALGEGGSKIAKPVRDLVNWVGDTADAKGENQDLKKDVASLRTQNAQLQTRLRKFPNMQKLAAMVDDLQLRRNDPLSASVIGKSPTAWATTITIDRGSNDGVQLRQAVVGAAGPGAGLVGFVSAVKPNLATVSLLPSQDVAIGAHLDGVKPVLTIRGAGAGSVDDLELEFVPSTTEIKTGAVVTTSGTVDDPAKFPSNAPADLPIGRVWKVDQRGTDEQIGHVRPFVDLRTLEDVQVLRRVINGNRPRKNPVATPTRPTTSTAAKPPASTTPPATTTPRLNTTPGAATTGGEQDGAAGATGTQTDPSTGTTAP